MNKISKVRDYFIDKIKERELMIKRLSKYIASFNYFDKSLIVLSVTTGSIFIASFATVIGAPVGITSASFSFAFSISTGIVKTFLKTTQNKKKKHNKIVTLARSNLNSIESKTSEEKNYWELKESVRIMNSQRKDTKKINLIEENKKIGIDEVIKYNEINNNTLKSEI